MKLSVLIVGLLVTMLAIHRADSVHASNGPLETVALSPDKKVELRLMTKTKATLNRTEVVLAPGTGNEPSRVSVSLDASAYDSDVYQEVGSPHAWKWHGRLCYYELHSASAAHPYSWGIWSYDPCYNFSLSSDGKRKNYLGWVTRNGVYVAEVSASRTRKKALADLVADRLPPKTEHVPVVSLAGLRTFLPPNGLADVSHLDIKVQSVFEDSKRRLIVQVTGPRSAEVLTFVKDNGKWRKA